MAQALPLPGDLVTLSRLHRSGIGPLHEIFELASTACGLLGVLMRRGQRLSRRTQVGPGRSHGGQPLAVRGVAVQQSELHSGFRDPLGLVLG